MMRLLGSALVMVPLLGGVSAEAAPAGPNGHILAMNHTSAILKVAEWCGDGSFKDEYGHCRPWYGAAPNPHEACPPHRHFEPWVRHEGGRCVPNY